MSNKYENHYDIMKRRDNTIVFLGILSYSLLLILIICLAIIFADPTFWELSQKEKFKDSIHLALVTGRLDVVTIILATTSFMLVVIGIVGYQRVIGVSKRRAEKVAGKVANDVARDVATKLVGMIVDEKLAKIYKDELRTAASATNNDEVFKKFTAPFPIENEITFQFQIDESKIKNKYKNIIPMENDKD